MHTHGALIERAPTHAPPSTPPVLPPVPPVTSTPSADQCVACGAPATHVTHVTGPTTRQAVPTCAMGPWQLEATWPAPTYTLTAVPLDGPAS